MNILMSFSDGLDPSIFCGKMERTRPIRERIDGKVVISHQSGYSYFDFLIL